MRQVVLVHMALGDRSVDGAAASVRAGEREVLPDARVA
jgi:hypothetical protein